MEYGGTNYGVTPVVWGVVKDKAMPPLQQLELFESLARDAAQSATREKKRADELAAKARKQKRSRPAHAARADSPCACAGAHRLRPVGRAVPQALPCEATTTTRVHA